MNSNTEMIKVVETISRSFNGLNLIIGPFNGSISKMALKTIDNLLLVEPKCPSRFLKWLKQLG